MSSCNINLCLFLFGYVKPVSVRLYLILPSILVLFIKIPSAGAGPSVFSGKFLPARPSVYKSGEDMEFEDKFTEYLLGDEGRLLNKYCHFEYKRLKNDLNSCKHDRSLHESHAQVNDDCQSQSHIVSQILPCPSCQRCDQMFFQELLEEASKMAGCFRMRVERLVHHHLTPGMKRYLLRLFQCFKYDKQALVQEGWMLIQFVIMNAIALRKILEKYDKVHESANGRNFKSMLQAKRLEILQSPWLIELVAFCMNSNDSTRSDDQFGPLSFDLNVTEEESVLTLTLPDSKKLEHNLTCPICLDIVFQPYALSCGHLFCKSCACSASSVMFIEGVRSASPESKCPVCRESGVYAKAVRMSELGLLLEQRFKEHFKERLLEEREKAVKQAKAYWEMQRNYMLGF